MKTKIFIKRILTLVFCVIMVLLFSVPSTGEQDNEELSDFEKAKASITFDDFNGAKAGVLEGSIQDDVVAEHVKNSEFVYYKSMADELIALHQKKVDFLLLIDEQFSTVTDLYPDLCSLPSTYVECGEEVFMFGKENKNERLYAEINEFIIKMRNSGGLNKLEDFWFAPGKKTMEAVPKSGENGVIKVVTTCAIPPFTFIQDGIAVGFEMDIIGRFAREYGYGVEIIVTDNVGALASVQTGKADIAINCIGKTPERLEEMSATETVCIPHYSFIVSKDTVTEMTGVKYEEDGSTISFFESIKESFRKTFVYEKRGIMVLDGMIVTVEITLVAAILGIVLGFLLYFMNISSHAVYRRIVYVFNHIMSGTPILVLLMVFYYVIFRQSLVTPFWVACTVFGLNFASVMSVIYQSCFGSINKGQVEAALALGYSERKAFGKFVLPQALMQILPLAKGQLVSLLKSTSIVGYIAIVDLTKAGDLIRSKTFEAFFPLISIAVIYFIMAWLIRLVIGKIEFKTDWVKKRDASIGRSSEEQIASETMYDTDLRGFNLLNIRTAGEDRYDRNETVIKIEHLNKAYPNAVPLKDMNAEVKRGDIITIIGPSGTGKSTVLRCINGLETPTTGKITVLGTEVTDNSAELKLVRQKTGMVFQSFNLFDHLTCLENIIAAPMDIKKVSRAAAVETARRLLRQVGLEDKENSFPAELSGGQKQRVAIARALAMEPEILLLDEPTSALDPAIVKEVQYGIENISNSGVTILVVSHDMSFARHISNRIFYLDEGVLYEEGSPGKIFDNPEREKTRLFVESGQTQILKYHIANFNGNNLLVKIGSFALEHEINKALSMKLYSLLDELVIVGLEDYSDKNELIEIKLTAKNEYVRFSLGLYGKEYNILEHCDEISLRIIENIVSLNYSYENNANLLTGEVR